VEVPLEPLEVSLPQPLQVPLPEALASAVALEAAELQVPLQALEDHLSELQEIELQTQAWAPLAQEHHDHLQHRLSLSAWLDLTLWAPSAVMAPEVVEMLAEILLEMAMLPQENLTSGCQSPAEWQSCQSLVHR